MRITIVCVITLLVLHPGMYAQADTAKNKSTPTASSIINQINRAYDNMEQAIQLEYTRLMKENKKSTEELREKIKQMDQQVEKLKETIRKLEEVAAHMKALLPGIMEAIGTDRKKVNNWGKSGQTSHLISIRDSILQTLPVQIAVRKDSLIRLSQLH